MSGHRLYNDFNKSLNMSSGSIGPEENVKATNSKNAPECVQNNKESKTLAEINKMKSKTNCVKATASTSEITDVSDENSVVEGAESDSDSMNERTFFTQLNQKLPYTRDEDEFIVEFVLRGQNIFRTGSLSLWKQMEIKKKKPPRTYQSLKNRFLKNIKPHLFTSFGHLIPDENTKLNIIAKFPELHNAYRKKPKKLSLNSPRRNLLKKTNPALMNLDHPTAGEGRISSVNLIEGAKSAEIKEENELSSVVCIPNIFGQGHNKKTVEFKNNTFVVTIDRSVFFPDKASTSCRVGVYEKFLKLKKNNVLTPCPQCGRGDSDFEIDVVNCSEDDDHVIQSSVGTPKKRSVNGLKQTVDNSSKLKKSGLNKRTQKRKKRTAKERTVSPSLLDNDFQIDKTIKEENQEHVEDECDITEDKSQLKCSDELGTDLDSDSLCKTTVAHCRLIVDSDAEEEQAVVNSLKKQSASFCSVLSGENDNAEFFFLNPNPPVPEVEVPVETDEVPVKKMKLRNDTVKKSPLAVNMAKMLKKIL